MEKLSKELFCRSTRTIIRYGLEINDPWLPELVRCVDAGESIIANLYLHSSEEKIEALTDLICRGGDEPSAALPAPAVQS